MSDTILLAYGESGLGLTLDRDRFDVTVLAPRDVPGIADPRAALAAAVRTPLGTAPLRDILSKCSAKDPRTTIVISDHTRPTPDALLVPAIVEELGARDDSVTILVGTGTHRESTEDELKAKLGKDTLERFRIVNHRCDDEEDLIAVGTSSCGGTVTLNRAYVEANIRIVTGFVEPHFFAGFSGGPKAVVPGVAGLATVRHAHRPRLIAEPGSTWGEIAANPLQTLLREMVNLCPPDFMVNVTMNRARRVTGIFCGDFRAAHDEACRKAAREALIKVDRVFPAVVTTNSGYPLDRNFYQAVKGISAASRTVEDGGVVISASECRDGMPEDGEFTAILAEDGSPGELLDRILGSDRVRRDVWQAQILLQCVLKSRILLLSSLSPEDRRRTRTGTTTDIEDSLERLRASLGVPRLPVAVMPLGPLTIPARVVE